ncbi:MAG: DUF4883 family protein [Clostridium sp.]
MKKSILFLIIVLATFSLIGCKSLFINEKPSNAYYTKNLLSDLSTYENCHANALYMNFYKGERLEEDEFLIARKFLKYIQPENFIEKPTELPETPVYKMYFTFNESKYVINIYNQKYISIYPWDGDYAMDFIDMSSSYTSYNLFNLCEYIFER